MSRIERSLEELYSDDSERAEAEIFGRRTGPNRRGFLNGAGLAALGAAVGGAIPFASAIPSGFIPAAFAQGTSSGSGSSPGPQPLDFPGKNPNLSVLGERPLVAETPEHLLDDETTPTEKFFIRNNGQIPESPSDPDSWEITIDGEVNAPLKLTLGELKSRF
ncbi:twin-arginine translocation signal domain-containing protein [Microvirga massiliensis]|uniref:twin-arginine translocation signal domain-containing protein n=1 Tax=Microvirga massiliensis TaxID=1033741 RepID=UPI000B0F9E43|nr:twin-arginine translocation signal domain-containing protein [Microvirga massiliensis]